MKRFLQIAGYVASVSLLGFGILSDAYHNGAFGQEREFTLKMNNADLQVLDAAINKAPLPREVTQPFVTKMQAQIVEQMKASEAKPAPNTTSGSLNGTNTVTTPVDANSSAGTPTPPK